MENKYFEKMDATLKQYYNIREQHNELKETIRKEHGYDSVEMEVWYEMNEQIEKMYPYTEGQAKAYMAWRSVTGEEFYINQFLWEREVADFVKTLREAGITEFGYYNRSTAVMENIHQLAENGCELVGLTERTEKDWHDVEYKVKGLKFRVTAE